jgi:hypothetical protein
VVELGCDPEAEEALGFAPEAASPLCGMELVPEAPAAPAAAPVGGVVLDAPLWPWLLQLAETWFTLSTRKLESPVACPVMETVEFG